MPLVHIALQEGFAGEPVVILLNGREIFRNEHVKTRTQIGLAASVEERLAAGDAAIDVQAGGARREIRTPLSEDLYLGVSLTGDKQIVYRTSTQPFGYA